MAMAGSAPVFVNLVADHPPLSEGFMERVLKPEATGETEDRPILQVIGHRPLNNGNRYRLLISDGRHCNAWVILATKLNDLVKNGTLTRNCVIRVDKHICNSMESSVPGNAATKIIIILELEVLCNREGLSTIGNPVHIDPDGTLPIDIPASSAPPSAASANISANVNGNAPNRQSSPPRSSGEPQVETVPGRSGFGGVPRAKGHIPTGAAVPITAMRTPAITKRPTGNEIIGMCLTAYEGNAAKVKLFNEFTSDLQRFSAAQVDIDRRFPGLVPEIRFHGKDIEKTKEWVAQALGHVAGKQYVKALEMFNKAVLVAPWRSRETPKEEVDFCFATILGHRATVLFHLQQFIECIFDIDQAISLECSHDTMEKLLLLKAEAFLAVKRPSDSVFALVEEVVLLRLFRREVNEGEEPDEEKKRYDSLLKKAEMENANASRRKKQAVMGPTMRKHPTYVDMFKKVKKRHVRYGRSKKFPCASSGVELKSDHSGSHFVARKEFKIGDVVLVEPSFVSFLKSTETVLTRYCYACCVYTDTPFPCWNCSSIVYCSPLCASGPKGALHNRECSFWKTILGCGGEVLMNEPAPGNSTMAVVMAMRTLFMKTLEEWREFLASVPDYTNDKNHPILAMPKGAYLSDDCRSVFSLTKNPRHHCPSDFAYELCTATALTMKVLDKVYFLGNDRIPSGLRPKLGALLVHLATNYTTNWDRVREQDMHGNVDGVLGNAAGVIHPTASFFKQSCNANLFSWHYGDYLVLKVCRPVKPGEILYVNKIGHYDEQGLFERQALAGAMGFTCKCNACLERWPQSEVLSANFARGIWRVKCMSCPAVFDVQASGGPRQRCVRCGKDVGEWLLAYRPVISELFLKGRWDEPRDVRSLVSLVERIYQLCGEPSYAVLHASKLIDSWLTNQALDATHPGRKARERAIPR